MSTSFEKSEHEAPNDTHATHRFDPQPIYVDSCFVCLIGLVHRFFHTQHLRRIHRLDATLICTGLILCLADKFHPTPLAGTRVLDVLFLSTFQPSTDPYWVTMLTLITIFAFLTGPLYILISKIWFDDAVPGQEAYQQFEDARIDTIAENEAHAGEKYTRLAVSYFLFVVCLGVPVIIMYLLLFIALSGFMQGEYDRLTNPSLSSSDYLQTLLGLGVSSVVTISNTVFENGVMMLTKFEKHQSWSMYRKHRLAKMVRHPHADTQTCRRTDTHACARSRIFSTLLL